MLVNTCTCPNSSQSNDPSGANPSSNGNVLQHPPPHRTWDVAYAIASGSFKIDPKGPLLRIRSMTRRIEGAVAGAFDDCPAGACDGSVGPAAGASDGAEEAGHSLHVCLKYPFGSLNNNVTITKEEIRFVQPQDKAFRSIFLASCKPNSKYLPAARRRKFLVKHIPFHERQGQPMHRTKLQWEMHNCIRHVKLNGSNKVSSRAGGCASMMGSQLSQSNASQLQSHRSISAC